MQLLRLPKSKVKIGVPLPWNVRLEDESLLLRRGQIVEDQHQLDLLLERGAFVDAEEVRTYGNGNLAAEVVPPKELPRPARQINLFELWEKTIRRLEDLLKGFPGSAEFAAQVDTLARDIVALVERDADIAIYMMVRQDKVAYSTYGYTHAVHAALVCILMARRMQWPAAQVVTLAKAALTMNAPIMALLGRLAAQEGPVLDKQKAELKQHPDKAVEWLKQAGVTEADWLTAVAQHHERPDGSGYPLGLSEVSPMAQALHHADVFIDTISRQVSREALSPQEAARQLFREDKGGPMSVAIIKEIGIYPPGDFVKLKSGELAVVIRHGENAKTPLAACITDASGKPISSTPRRDTARPEFEITGAVADKSMAQRVPPERLYGFSVMGA